MSTLSRYAEQNFGDRLTALGVQPRVPVPVMARAFVGAHVAIVKAWLAGELDGDIEELASMTLDLLIYGAAWAHRLRPGELRSQPAPGRGPTAAASTSNATTAPSSACHHPHARGCHRRITMTMRVQTNGLAGDKTPGTQRVIAACRSRKRGRPPGTILTCRQDGPARPIQELAQPGLDQPNGQWR